MAGTSPAMTNYRLNLNSSDPSSAGTANRDAVDAQRWLADADRDALTVLAASADAVVESEIVADHRNAMQVGRPIADQHGALDRRGGVAVRGARAAAGDACDRFSSQCVTRPIRPIRGRIFPRPQSSRLH